MKGFFPILIVLMIVAFVTLWATSLKFRDLLGLPSLQVLLGLSKAATTPRVFVEDPETGEEREVVRRGRTLAT